MFRQLHYANSVTARHRHGRPNAEINVFIFTATSLYEATTDPCPYYQQCLKRALVLHTTSSQPSNACSPTFYHHRVYFLQKVIVTGIRSNSDKNKIDTIKTFI